MIGRVLLIGALLLTAGCQKRTPEVATDAGGEKATAAIVSAAPADAGAPTAEAAPIVEAGTTDAGSPVWPFKEPPAPRWIVKDNKTRCIQAPCMSLDAMPVGSSASTEKISDVDLSALALSNTEQQQVMSHVYGGRGLEVEGEIFEEPEGTRRRAPARILRVVRVLTAR